MNANMNSNTKSNTNAGMNFGLNLAVRSAGRCLARARYVAHGLALTLGLASAAVCAPKPAGNELIINKQVVSSDVRMIGGKAYAPLSDIARAFDMKVVQRGNGYELTREGGATQIANKLVGKMGQELFSGEWRFQVTSVETMREYAPVYNNALFVPGRNLKGSEKAILPKPGDKLIVVHCRLKNGLNTKQTMAFLRDPDAVADYTALNTALTDADGQSLALYATDVRVDDSYYGLVKTSFLPGAALAFNLLFSVTSATQPKDLIYSAARIGSATRIDEKRVTDFRVSLTSE